MCLVAGRPRIGAHIDLGPGGRIRWVGHSATLTSLSSLPWPKSAEQSSSSVWKIDEICSVFQKNAFHHKVTDTKSSSGSVSSVRANLPLMMRQAETLGILMDAKTSMIHTKDRKQYTELH